MNRSPLARFSSTTRERIAIPGYPWDRSFRHHDGPRDISFPQKRRSELRVSPNESPREGSLAINRIATFGKASVRHLYTALLLRDEKGREGGIKRERAPLQQWRTRGAGNFRKAGSWPLAFRHWPTRLNNPHYVIPARVRGHRKGQAGSGGGEGGREEGKGGKSANEKRRRSKKVARDEHREEVGTMEVDHLRTEVSDTSLMRTLFFLPPLLPPSLLLVLLLFFLPCRSRLEWTSPNRLGVLPLAEIGPAASRDWFWIWTFG